MIIMIGSGKQVFTGHRIHNLRATGHLDTASNPVIRAHVTGAHIANGKNVLAHPVAPSSCSSSSYFLTARDALVFT